MTEVGQRVLEGHYSFVELNGIDDWVGGVHLDSRSGRVWLEHERWLEEVTLKERRTTDD